MRATSHYRRRIIISETWRFCPHRDRTFSSLQRNIGECKQFKLRNWNIINKRQAGKYESLDFDNFTTSSPEDYGKKGMLAMLAGRVAFRNESLVGGLASKIWGWFALRLAPVRGTRRGGLYLKWNCLEWSKIDPYTSVLCVFDLGVFNYLARHYYISVYELILGPNASNFSWQW